jgi:CubicO group peptidase (beta-lactamase class C family)
MKRRDLPLISLLLLGFVIAAITSGTTIPTVGVRGHAASQSASPSALEERIKLVENGLLPPFVIKGQPSAPMKLADRMKFYKTPGISIAVINKGRIEWARGYGVRETGGSEAVTPQTLFQAASISKPVAAMAALRFVLQV